VAWYETSAKADINIDAAARGLVTRAWGRAGPPRRASRQGARRCWPTRTSSPRSGRRARAWAPRRGWATGPSRRAAAASVLDATRAAMLVCFPVLSSGDSERRWSLLCAVGSLAAGGRPHQKNSFHSTLRDAPQPSANFKGKTYRRRWH